MSAYTLGPWAAHPQALLGVHQPELQCWIPQNRADSLLIAAAPDLLEALGQVLNAMIHLELSDSSKNEWEAAKAVAYAAISKATGGAA
jgi:hypothetical protein